MKKRLQGFVAGALSMLILTGAFAFAKQAYEAISVIYNDIKIEIDGERFIAQDANGAIVEPFIYNGTTYLPVRAIAEAFDKKVAWDEQTYTVSLKSILSHDEYMEAELDSDVIVETYVQAKQSWWDNKATVYAQDKDGGYFLYNLRCSEEDFEKLTIGQKIRVYGYKTEWAGQIEIADGTFEIVEGDTYIAEPEDVTALLGTDELIRHQSELVSFKGLTVAGIEYKNYEAGDDIYVLVTDGKEVYNFQVERYLTDPDTEVYKKVCELEKGDIVDIEGFLYWYEGVNPHITAISKVNQ